MGREIIDVSIMFVDISGSTKLYETLGDENAYRVVNRSISVLAGIIRQNKGIIIKTIGDEVMCTFSDACHAVSSAIEMDRAFEKMFRTRLSRKLRHSLRIGLHAGQVIRKENDVFGDAVNVAARMVTLAKPKQIVTTQEIIDRLPQDTDVLYRCVDRTRLKGKGGEFSIFEIVWDEDEITLLRKSDDGSPMQSACLRLRYRKKEICMDRERPSVTLGRLSDNDLVVDDHTASRFHARIEYNRGRFVLKDQSSNGTYVFLDGGEPALVHNDECVLSSSGFISLGREAGSGSAGMIRFSCDSLKK